MWAEKSIKNNKTTKTVMFYASHLIFSALDDILKSHVRCTGKCGYCWNVVMPHRAPTGANNTQTNSNTEGSKTHKQTKDSCMKSFHNKRAKQCWNT